MEVGRMALEERSSWIQLAVSVVLYGVYLSVIIREATSGPLVDIDYAPAMLWTIGIAIVTSIVVNIAISIVTPRRDQKRDVRDRDIARTGDRVGQSFLVIGALGALLLAVVEADYFYIANALYLAFVLSSVLGSATKVVIYRRGF
jgi:small-conductance mechanosensitive channel